MLVTSGFSKGKALGRLEERSGFYDPSALTSLKEIIGIESKYEIRSVSVKELKEQMILNEDITSRDGLMLMSKGQEVSRTMIKRLSSFSYTTKIKEPIKVLVPLTDKAALVR